MALWLAKAQIVDGIRFASIDEVARYQELKVLQRAGQVLRFDCHPSWSFVIGDVLVGKYTADFLVIYPSGEVVVEDVKGNGPTSRDYVLRKKLLLAMYGLPVVEIRMRPTRNVRRQTKWKPKESMPCL